MTMSRTRPVLPGFGITMGFTLMYLSLIVLILLTLPDFRVDEEPSQIIG